MKTWRTLVLAKVSGSKIELLNDSTRLCRTGLASEDQEQALEILRPTSPVDRQAACLALLECLMTVKFRTH